MGNVLVVGAGPQRARLIDRSLTGTSFHVRRCRWVTFLHEQRDMTPELVIYDLAGPDAPRVEVLAQLPSEMPGTSVLYLCGPEEDCLEHLAATLEQPNVDFVLSPEDPRELRLRAHRLLARRQSAPTLTREDIKISPMTAHGVMQHLVPALHAPNGRLDARAVSTLFGISLAALARALGRSEQAVHKTPTAESLQGPLRLFERVAAALLRLTGNEAGLRAWAHARNPELEEETPINLLLHGEGEVVADLLEAVLTGEPA